MRYARTPLTRAFERELETGIEYVIGPTDDRFHIPARPQRPSTLLFPMNTICFLEVDTGGGRFVHQGTGTLIAPQVVLTAKHVLMDVDPGFPPCEVARHFDPCRFFPRMRVTPGADLQAAAGQQRPAQPSSIIADRTRFRVHPNLDFGIIILPTPFTRPNQFMMLQARGDERTATLLTIAGYPCDKPKGTMWGHSSPIPLTDVTPTHLRYTIDTCPGHSGSPIWLLGNDEIRLLLGVHTGGVNRCENDPVAGICLPTGAPVTPVAGQNCGVRLTCNVINTIVGWCRDMGVREPVIDQVVQRRRCSAPPAAHPLLRRGSRSAAVQELQTRLNLWILTPPGAGRPVLVADGIFGANTEAAVRAFQAAGCLGVDGVVGPRTWGALPPL